MKKNRQYSTVEIVGITVVGFIALVTVLTILNGTIQSDGWLTLLSTLAGN